MAVDQRWHSTHRGGRLLDAIRRAEANFGQSPPELARGGDSSAAFLAAGSVPAVPRVPIEPVSEPQVTAQLSLGGIGEAPIPATEDLYPGIESRVDSIAASVAANPEIATGRTEPPRIKLHLPRWPEIEELAKTIVGNLPELSSAVLAFVTVDRHDAGLSIAAPLARALTGRHGEQVLLVESDVQASLRTSEAFYQPQPGFAEICTQQIAWSDAILPTVIERLAYLPAGLDVRAFPVDGEFAAQLFADLKRRFKYVVIDAGASAEALAAGWLAPCDEIYLAVELGRTAPHRARDAARQIVAAGGKIGGSIALETK